MDTLGSLIADESFHYTILKIKTTNEVFQAIFSKPQQKYNFRYNLSTAQDKILPKFMPIVPSVWWSVIIFSILYHSIYERQKATNQIC